MANPKTPTLGLEIVPYAIGKLDGYTDVLEFEQKLSASLNTVDRLMGMLTASQCVASYTISGSLSTMNGQYLTTFYAPD